MSVLRSFTTKNLGLSRVLKKLQDATLSSTRLKSVSDSQSQETPNLEKQTNLQSKYQVFKDESEVILDIYDERNAQYSYNLPEAEIEREHYEGLNLNRGVKGVFDIEDLIDVLKREHVLDIFVARVPEHVKYVDYMCCVSCKSSRHMEAVMQFVRRIYKMKRSKSDIIPKLEGAKSKDWQALDLGNIALHVFSKEARQHYDLDYLWAVGPELDPEYNKKDPIVDMLEKNTLYLNDLKPAS